MNKLRPPVILATIIVSLILSLALLFIPWSNPAASAPSANTPAAQASLPTQTPPSSQAPASINPSDTSQVVIPNQPAAASNQPAAPAPNNPVALNTFVKQVKDGQPDQLTGVYVDSLLALKVVPQPAGEVGYVSTDPGTATQFQLPAPGVTGLLAHNVLDGAEFLELKTGQEISLVYGDGSIRRYQIEGLREFQRLDPSNLQSDFIETQTGAKMTSQQVFDWFYTGSPHLTLQTCVAKNGDLAWGVRFIVARPLT